MVFVSEPNLVDQFTHHLGPLVLTPDQSQQILEHLRLRYKSRFADQENERLRIQTRLGQLKKWSEQAYLDKLDGTITEDQWKVHVRTWDLEIAHLQTELVALNDNGAAIITTAEKILELAQKLPQLWVNQNSWEKRKLIDLVYSNCQLNGGSLSLTYRKPFSFIAEGSQSQIWRGTWDSNRQQIIHPFSNGITKCRQTLLLSFFFQYRK